MSMQDVIDNTDLQNFQATMSVVIQSCREPFAVKTLQYFLQAEAGNHSQWLKNTLIQHFQMAWGNSNAGQEHTIVDAAFAVIANAVEARYA
jgi:hypothetical protein